MSRLALVLATDTVVSPFGDAARDTFFADETIAEATRRGLARAGFAVEGRVVLHIVRDVGDADDDVDLLLARALLCPDGVVEVLGGLAVDGDDGQLAQVLAADKVRVAGDLAEQASVSDDGGRERAVDARLHDEPLELDV